MGPLPLRHAHLGAAPARRPRLGLRLALRAVSGPAHGAVGSSPVKGMATTQGFSAAVLPTETVPPPAPAGPVTWTSKPVARSLSATATPGSSGAYSKGWNFWCSGVQGVPV